MELPNKRLSSQVSKNEWVSPAFFILAIVTLVLSMLFWWMTFVSNFNVNQIHITEAQTIEDLQAPVTDCEVKAEEGFTCILVPLMVSKEYAKDYSKEYK